MVLVETTIYNYSGGDLDQPNMSPAEQKQFRTEWAMIQKNMYNRNNYGEVPMAQ